MRKQELQNACARVMLNRLLELMEYSSEDKCYILREGVSVTAQAGVVKYAKEWIENNSSNKTPKPCKIQ